MFRTRRTPSPLCLPLLLACQPSGTTAPAEITVTPTAADLGQVGASDSELPTRILTFTNVGDSDVILTELSWAGQAGQLLVLEIEDEGEVLRPLDSQTVHVGLAAPSSDWTGESLTATLQVTASPWVRTANGCTGQTSLTPGDSMVIDVPVSFTLSCDEDGDGVRASACGGEDCDDSASTGADVGPDQPELCNGVDDDCSGTADDLPDEDGDGTNACEGDCHDGDALIGPHMAELCADGRDNDCDGTSNDCALSGSRPETLADGTLRSETDNARAGWAVTGLGDIDGDGVPDLGVGAPGAIAPGGSASVGAAWIVSGATLDWAVAEDTGATDSGAADTGGSDGTVLLDGMTAVTGTALNQQAGSAIAALGDTDGDGYDDFAVAAANFEGRAGTGAGGVWVFQGPIDGDQALTDGVGFEGAGAGDHAGTLLRMAPDITGDGRADLIIGAPYADDGAGAVYIIDGPFDRAQPLEEAQGRMYGETEWDYAGTSAAWAGDMDGDGIADMVVGAPSAGTGGRVYVVHGPVSTSVDLGASDGRVRTDEDFAELGAAAASGGDSNGDGYGDVVIGAPAVDGIGADAGAVYVLYGPITGTRTTGTAGATVSGHRTNDRFGDVVVSAGDLDGDGHVDALVGAPDAKDDSVGVGKAYVVYGPLTGAISAGDLPTSGGALLVGTATGGRLGQSVDTAGDLDRDGFVDIVVGAPGEDGGSVSHGAVYLLLGAGL